MKPKRRELKNGPARVIILGAGGRDFHNFNTCYRNRPSFDVVAFTATQIPYINHRVYPPDLAGTPLVPCAKFIKNTLILEKFCLPWGIPRNRGRIWKRLFGIPPVIPSSLQCRPTFEEALKSINRWLESFMILTLIFLALLITF